MKKEIGSEFWDIPLAEQDNNIFPGNAYWFVSGRSALIAIISDIRKYKQLNSVAMPSWCCDSIIVPFIQNGITVSFYNPFKQLMGINTDALVIMDYFGYEGHNRIEGYNGITIRDVTHSIFTTQHTDADYYFGSLRKWAGFASGGYAWGFINPITYEGYNQEYTNCRHYAMELKKQYISALTGHIDALGEKEIFLACFSRAEEQLNNGKIEHADANDISYAKKMNVEAIKERRRKNASVLLSGIKEFAIYPSLNKNDCPLFVPIRINNRDEVRKQLINQGIYCPVHWPLTEYHTIDEESKKIYKEELSLICDQRYDEKDMSYILEVVLSRKGEL